MDSFQGRDFQNQVKLERGIVKDLPTLRGETSSDSSNSGSEQPNITAHQLRIMQSNKEQLRKELTDRGVILVEAVDESFLDNVIWPFAKLASDNNIPKIKLLMNSPGGYLIPMFQLITMIRSCNKPVVAEVMFAASAAFMIASQCHDRIAYQGSLFMHHLPWTIVSGNMDEIERQTHYQRFATEYTEKLLIQRTKLTRKELKERRDQDWWMTAKDALQYGVIDRIVSEDTYALDPALVQKKLKKEEELVKAWEQD